jgi:O-acetyl-ADP-ribose deacetylase (regulator of RNase III)
MFFSITLVDINARLVRAWQEAFADLPEVQVVHGSILQLQTDAWVTPTNVRARMDGGVDAVMKRYFGDTIEKRVQREINCRHGGRLPVGRATCVSTGGLHVPPGGHQPRYLVSAPTMCASSQDVSATDNVAWATAAAFQAVTMRNAADPGSVRSLALPGLGAATGRVQPRDCADQMYAVYQFFRERQFEDFDEMACGLASYLGDEPPKPPRRERRKRLLGIF